MRINLKIKSNICLMKSFIFLVLLMLMVCCTSDNAAIRPVNNDQAQLMLFDILTPEQTGINFENKITGDRLYQNQNGKFIDVS